MAAERELIYRVKVVADETNRKALREHVAEAKAAEEQIAAIRKEQARVRAQEDARRADTDQKQNVRMVQERRRAMDTIANEERRRREESRIANAAHFDRMRRDVEAAERRMTDGRNRMIEGYTGLGESVAKVARGVATLGLVGEESTKKLITGLIKVQGLYDLTVGSLKTMVSLTKLLQGASLVSGASADLTRLGRGGILSGAGRLGGTITGAAAAAAGGSNLTGIAADVGTGLTAGSLGETATGTLKNQWTKRSLRNAVSETISTALGDAAGEVASEALRGRRGRGTKAATEAIGEVFEAMSVGGMRTITSGHRSQRGRFVIPEHLFGGGLDFPGSMMPPAMRQAEAAATHRLLMQRAGGFVGEGMMGVGASAASRAAASGITMGGGAMTAGAAGGGFLAKSAFGFSVGTAGTAGAIAAALAGLGAAATVVTEQLTGAAKKTDSWTNTIANWEVNASKAVFSFFGDKTLSRIEAFFNSAAGRITPLAGVIAGGAGLARSERRLASQQQANEAMMFRRIAGEMQAEITSPLLFAARQQREGQADVATGLMTDPRQRLASIKLQADLAAAGRGSAMTGIGRAGTDAEREALVTEAARLAEREAELAKDRLSTEREIISERRKLIQDGIEGASKELELTKERISQERDRLKSAAERFAELDPLKRAQAIGAITQARNRGGASLSGRQRQLLRGIGDTESLRFAEQSALSEAGRAGFFRNFGREEQAEIGRLSAESRKLQVEVADKRQLLVQIDRNEDALAKTVAGQVANLIQERDKLLLGKIKEEVQRNLANFNRNQDAQVRARAAAVKGG